MNEHYLHLLWRLKRLPLHQLSTTNGQAVSVQHAGFYNRESGPDFFNGRIVLDGIVHAGNIEMHVKSSDWYLHGHQHDRAYDNVILHVVYEYDKPVRIGETEIPTIELKRLVDPEHFERSEKIRSSPDSIPCSSMIAGVPAAYVQSQLQLSLSERLKRKSNDWAPQFSSKFPQEALFTLLASAFGMKVNALPFLELANRLPLRALLRTRAEDIEAIVFGVSGLLEKHEDSDYALHLAKTWDFHRSRLSLHAQNAAGWKQKGCRPAGFPAIRLAQFATCIHRMDWSQDFWEQAPEELLDSIRRKLCVPLSAYWRQHYDFGKKHKSPVSGMSQASADVVIINAAIPFLGFLAAQTSRPSYNKKALALLALIPGEKNAIVGQWKMLGLQARNAGDSQGLLELKNEFCNRKKCLECKIGAYLLGR